MDSFDDNKIKDANMFADDLDETNKETENADDLGFDDPEEVSAVNEMVRNIAGSGNKERNSSNNNEDINDEEIWSVSENVFFSKLFSKKKSDNGKRLKKKVTPSVVENEKSVKEDIDEEKSIENDLFNEDEDDFFEIVKEEAEDHSEEKSVEANDRKDDVDIEVDHNEDAPEVMTVEEDQANTDHVASEVTEQEDAEFISAKEDAERLAAKEEAAKIDDKEMRSAVEDMMYVDETDEERRNRHEKEAELQELPKIDLSDIDFFSEGNNSSNETDIVIDEIGEHLAMFVNDEIAVKKKKWPKVVAAVCGTILVLAAFLLFTRPGHTLLSKAVARFIFSNVETMDDQQARMDEQEAMKNDKEGELVHSYTSTPTPASALAPTGAVGTDEPTLTPTPTPYIDYHPHYQPDPSVVNILLIGYENHEGYKYGRSDSMMIASMDKDGGNLKLVSLMRDMYVEIPGYNDNRLNAAYFFGGPQLLMETIELNFGLICDGYAIVDYSGFESIVDYIGGIEISLTAEESEYLNTTNYISNKNYRNTEPGNQLMNGNQVVGYCRIRKVPTSNGLYMDFGRTYRQRTVMDKIFGKFKDSSVSTLYGVMMECFKYVKCSENLEPIASECIQAVVEKQMFKLDTYRIPVSGHYNETKINGAQVIAFDSDNADILHGYLYGEGD